MELKKVIRLIIMHFSFYSIARFCRRLRLWLDRRNCLKLFDFRNCRWKFLTISKVRICSRGSSVSDGYIVCVTRTCGHFEWKFSTETNFLILFLVVIASFHTAEWGLEQTLDYAKYLPCHCYTGPTVCSAQNWTRYFPAWNLRFLLANFVLANWIWFDSR